MEKIEEGLIRDSITRTVTHLAREHNTTEDEVWKQMYEVVAIKQQPVYQMQREENRYTTSTGIQKKKEE